MISLSTATRPPCRYAHAILRSPTFSLQAPRYISSVVPVQSTTVSLEDADISQFREAHFTEGLPLHFQGLASSSQHAGRSKWFSHLEGQSSPGFSPFMDQFSGHIFPYELTRPPPNRTAGRDDSVAQFLSWLTSSSDPTDHGLAEILRAAMTRAEESFGTDFFVFEAPLNLIMRASRFNAESASKLTQLYIAQSQIDDLPDQLKDDLATPRLVQETGKGDVYSSSIWIGLEPTFTSLHRDPNPNLFLQLLNAKQVRLMPPTTGERLYREVQTRLGRTGNSRIRGLEMMNGPERIMLSAAVWGSEAPRDCFQADLDAGDALFIPKGWWHSVKSTQRDGRLNASANWWFR